MCKPVFLTVAGSDCSGGAGIQADIKTAGLLDCYPCSVVTVVTAQNTSGVKGTLLLPDEFVSKQLECILSDFYPAAVKIGLVGNGEQIETIANLLIKYGVDNIVIDPVLSFTLGANQSLNCESIKKMVDLLFPIATIVTPNLHEKEIIERIGRKPVVEMCNSVLIKGGHAEGDTCVDQLYFYDNGQLINREFSHKKINSENTHGTGCVLSSAIAAFLAKSFSLEKAVEKAISFLTDNLLNSKTYNPGRGFYGPCLI